MGDASSADQAVEEVVITYLEMFERPAGLVPAPPRPDVQVMRGRRPTLSFYRYLFDVVGGPWRWLERRLMDDEALASIIHDERVEVQVLYAGGVPAGYAELDRRQPDAIQLTYFGLVPEFIGQGLGAFFLDWVVDYAWSLAPGKLWVHTCTRDHPRALPNYRRAGFETNRVERKRLPAASNA